MVLAISPSLTFWSLVPGLVVFGLGIGFAGSQLTNVILSEIPTERSGAASGANTTVRQLGAALGIAIIGSLLTSVTISRAVSGVRDASFPASLQEPVVAGLHQNGVNFRAPAGATVTQLARLGHIVEDAVASGTRTALLFAMVVVVIGALVSLLIPRIKVPDPRDQPDQPSDVRTLEGIESLGPVSASTVEPTASEWKG
jgi:hypothetical protein